MAEIDFGVEGGVSGKLGNFVLYRVGGKTYLRRRPRRREGALTEKQVRQQSKMAGAMVMHRFVKECELREVFAAWSREVGARSGYNLFLSKNMNAFGEEDYVDYGLLTLAGGSLQLPNELAVTDMADRRLGFAWVDNTSGETARGDDRMLAAVITDSEKHYKYPINDFSLIPRYAVLDYHETLGLPKSITATTGMEKVFAGRLFSD